MEICRYINDDIKYKPLWIAELSNGEIIYKFDGLQSSWLLLRDYIYKLDLHIVNIKLKFRTHIVDNIVPKNAEGYFFSNKIIKPIKGDEKSILRFFVIGFLKNKLIFTSTYKVPELTIAERGIRSFTKYEDFCIVNKRWLDFSPASTYNTIDTQEI